MVCRQSWEGGEFGQGHQEGHNSNGNGGTRTCVRGGTTSGFGDCYYFNYVYNCQRGRLHNGSYWSHFVRDQQNGRKRTYKRVTG